VVKEEMDLVTSCLKGRGLLSAVQQLNNYGLVTFTFGSKLQGQ
jgi:hypothetical protein